MKWLDIQKVLLFIPPIRHKYFKDLRHDGNEDDRDEYYPDEMMEDELNDFKEKFLVKLLWALCTLSVQGLRVLLKVTQPLQNAKNRQKFVFLDFCLILIFNPRTTICEIVGVKELAEVL